MSEARHEELLRLFTEACRLAPGDRPALLERECRNDEGMRHEIEALLAADDDPLLDPDDGGPGGGAQLLAEILADSGEFAPVDVPMPEMIGPYRIVREIARGGMGMVYEAQQEHPHRAVALKVIRAGAMSAQALRRFRNEAEVLGRLEHPGIARIFEAGTAELGDGNQPYYAMELIRGQPLDQYAENHSLDRSQRIELLAMLCDVLQYAHQEGVVHRDLKPSNVLVPLAPPLNGPHPTLPQPKILDFGIARSTGMDLSAATLETTMGQLLGTVAYMSPEQAAGDPTQVDARSDVYAVGVIAYELLTGRLPHDVRGKLMHEATRIVREDEPVRPSTLDRSLRGDVETILQKALQKDRRDRYPSAAALARDLRHHLASEPLEARPPGPLEQLRKLARRNRTLFGGCVATVLVALVGAGVATRFALRASRSEAQALRYAAEREQASYVAGLAAASSALDQHDPEAATRYLDTLPEELCGWESRYLRARSQTQEQDWELPENAQCRPVFGPEGRFMDVVLHDASVCTWDLQRATMVGRRALPGVEVRSGPPSVLLHGPTRRFAAVSTDNGLWVGDLDGRSPPVEAWPASRGVQPDPLDWDRTGRRLLHGGDRIRIFDDQGSHPVTEERFAHGAFHPDSRTVALSMGRTLAVYDSLTGECGSETALDDVIQDLRYSPDGSSIAVAGFYGSVRILDAESLEEVLQCAGHPSPLHSLAWSAGGGHLVSASDDGIVKVWNPVVRAPVAVLRAEVRTGPGQEAGRAAGQPHVACSPDGRAIMVASTRMSQFPLADPRVLRGHEQFVYSVAFSPDGALLASSAYTDPNILLWDVARGALLRRLEGPPHPRYHASGFGDAPAIAFGRDGLRLVAGTPHGTRQWEVGTGALLPASTLPGPAARFLDTLGHAHYGPSGSNAISPDRRLIANCLGTARVYEWDRPLEFPDINELTQRGGDTVFPQLALPEGGRLVAELEGHVGETCCVTFSPDGTRIATGGRDSTIRIWDARRYEQLLVLRGHDQYVFHLAFSPDGTLLASASGDKTVRLWDTLPLRERRRRHRD